MLLIVSESDDAHVPMVTPKLEERGANYLWFDTAHFPSEAQMAVGFDSRGLLCRTLWYGGHEYDLSTVTAVWNRRPRLPTVSPTVRDETHRKHAEFMSRQFLEGLWESMDCRWLPSKPMADVMANNKLIHLVAAARLGFSLPETLMTNHPDAFLEFYAAHGGGLISKALGSTDLKRDGQSLQVYTSPVRRRDTLNYRAIRHAPVIFQPYVPKQLELRVTVVGRHVFAAAISSQENRSTRHDWRHYDDPSVCYQPYDLPAELEARCVRLVEELRLSYGAIDLILTPDGDYVFLELNSNGQWGWIEVLTGMPIADAIADWLMSG
ncbi:MvdC/MvdD family ATP grasp protein [Archangium lansingense]|uniref:MvdC/MvdD family ATP grasp protein n=1 Tax=Archangium lansingense TaxID=2995310 RepID=UPI003B7D2158